MTISKIGNLILKAKINVLTGLHIGAGKDSIDIGGIDNPIVKHPHTSEPYIPGSSLKGKIRYLMEWAFGKIDNNGKPWNSKDASDVIVRIFGAAGDNDEWNGGPTRIICRDAKLNEEWRNKILENGQFFTEDKAEVVIDRLAGTVAKNAGPRFTERVASGAVFDAEFIFKIHEIDSDNGKRDKECLAWFIQGLSMLEQDALGGSGSRGYGQIRFDNLELNYNGKSNNSLDNIFRALNFNPDTPPKELLAIVENLTKAA